MNKKPNVYAIVPAAGVGTRSGAAIPKQYLTLQDGRTILQHTLQRLLDFHGIDGVLLGLNPVDEHWQDSHVQHPKLLACYAGGAERMHTVIAGIEYLRDQRLTEEAFAAAWVMVHDSVRPLLATDDLEALLDIGLCHPFGAILATPVRETIKRSDTDNNIKQTVDRQHLWLAQTPQLFPAVLLLAGLQQAVAQGCTVTDEAQAIELLGHQPKLVAGAADNIKITYAGDIQLAERYLTQQEAP